MLMFKNDVIIIDDYDNAVVFESFDEYLDCNGYVVIDLEEYARYILSTITKDVENPDVNTGELIDSSVDNFLAELRSDLIGTIENMIR